MSPFPGTEKEIHSMSAFVHFFAQGVMPVNGEPTGSACGHDGCLAGAPNDSVA